MKLPSVRFFLIFLLSTSSIPGANAQFSFDFSSFITAIQEVFTDIAAGTTTFFEEAAAASTGAVASVTTAVGTVVQAVVDVAGRAVGIPTASNTGVFCSNALDGIIGTLAAQFGDALDGVDDYGCTCQIVGNLPLPRIQVTCNIPEKVCFEDDTDNAEYCGFIELDMGVTIGNIDLIALTFDLANFDVNACWDFEDSGDGGSYKTMCINTDTNQDFDEFGPCSVTASDGSTTESCSCTPCNDGAGIIADCSAINLNTDPNGEELFLPATECVGPNNIDTFAIVSGEIDPDFHLFMMPLVRRAMQEQSN